jgi:hypothetical protein
MPGRPAVPPPEPFLGAPASLPAPEVEGRLAGKDARAPRFMVPVRINPLDVEASHARRS